MNRKSLFIPVLLAAGFITAASAQHVVYVTGSTAFRATVFTAATATSDIFDAPATVLPTGAGSGSGNIIYKGNIGGVAYELVCGWSGSEAGIANVAGKTSLANVKVPKNWNGYAGQTTGGTGPTDPFQNMPGVPYTFLDPAGNGTTFEATPRTADLAFADTSRAGSLTPDPSLTHEYGQVAVVTFAWDKGYESTPDSSWNNLHNVTLPELQYAVASAVSASFFTGDSADGDAVLLIGRNKGSGTHQNTFIDVGTYPAPSSQWAAYSSYQGTSPNLQLKFTGSPHASVAAAITANSSDQPGNTPSGDGFDSGSGVAGNMGLDWANTGYVALGYMGVSDALGAEANGAVRLTLNGVSYSVGAVTLGLYPYFGYEHIYGQPSPSGDANTVESHLASGINTYLVGVFNAADTTAGGIALSEMVANRPGFSDFGYPTQ